MEYPGPVVLPAAAVVAFGDYVLIHAQDAQVSPSTVITSVEYRFKNIDPIEVASEFAGPSNVGVVPHPGGQFRLLAPTPNPTHGAVAFSLELATASRVSAEILGVDGRLIRSLAPGELLGPGLRTLRWDGMSEAGTPVPSAMYFMVVRAEGEMRARRFLLTR